MNCLRHGKTDQSACWLFRLSPTSIQNQEQHPDYPRGTAINLGSYLERRLTTSAIIKHTCV
jgi:hypothetical protein